MKKLIPLVVILVILAGLVFLREEQRETPTISEQVKLDPLVAPDLKVSDLSRVELYAGAKPDEKVTLEKVGDVWQVASHFNAPADAEALDAFLESLVALKGESRATAIDDAALSAYSLKTDEAFHVVGYGQSGETPSLHVLFGKAPDFKTVFVRTADNNHVYVEQKNLRRDAGIFDEEPDAVPTADKWLAKEIVALEEDKITKLAYTLPDKTYVFERRQKAVEPAVEGEGEGEGEGEQPEYEWTLASEDPGMPFKETGVTSILSRFASLRAVDIVDPAKIAEWGLDEPSYKLAISTTDGKDIVLEGAQPEKGQRGYIKRSDEATGMVYALESYSFDQIFPKGAQFFELPKLSLNAADIQKVEIIQAAGNVVAERTENGWQLLEPKAPLAVDTQAFDTLATTAATWQAEDFAQTGVETATFDSTLTLYVGDATHTISLDGESRMLDGRYLRLGESQTVLAASNSKLDQLFLKPVDVFELALLETTADQAERISVILDGKTLELAKKDAVWNVMIGDTAGASADELVNALFSLEPTDFAMGATATTPVYATIQVTGAGVTTPEILTVNAEQAGFFSATRAGAPVQFKIAADAVAAFTEQVTALVQASEKPAVPEEVRAVGDATAAVPDAAVNVVAPAPVVVEDAVTSSEDKPTIFPAPAVTAEPQEKASAPVIAPVPVTATPE